VLQVEAPDVRAPEEIEIRCRSLRTMPPQPQNPRLPPTLASRQPLDLDQDERANHDGQGSPSAPPLVALMVVDLRVQLSPRPRTRTDP
jgi:hypothetical protein